MSQLSTETSQAQLCSMSAPSTQGDGAPKHNMPGNSEILGIYFLAATTTLCENGDCTHCYLQHSALGETTCPSFISKLLSPNMTATNLFQKA